MSAGAKRWPQYLATFAATMGAFGLGTGIAWASPALPLLKKSCQSNLQLKNESSENCAFTFEDGIDEDQAKWVSSIFNLGAMVAAVMTGILLGKVGRKWAMIINCVPMALGYLCLMFPIWVEGTNPSFFFVGRFLTGVGCGGFALAPPVYVGEVTETSIRGAMGACMQFMLTVGIIFVSAFGIEHCVTVNVISGLCLLPPIACALIMFFMPESPYYLITKGKISEAEKALSWFRGGVDVKDELAEMQRAYQDQQKIGSVSFVKLVADKVYLQPFVLMLALMFFQQFSGINAVNFNLVSIFQDVGSQMDEGLQGFIINIAQTCACGLAVVLVDRLGRKPLLSISGTLMSISIFGLGAFFYLKENADPDTPDALFKMTESEVKDIAWLPLACLIIYIVAFSIGFGPLPWAMNPELFPQESKDKGSSIMTVFNWFCSFLITYFFDDMKDALESSGCYFLFGSICIVGVLVILLFVPETKGKTNDDMRNYFLKRAGRPITSSTGMVNPAYTDGDSPNYNPM